MKIVFILNSQKKGISKLLPKLEMHCRERKLGNAQFLSTVRKKHAIDLAKRATENSCDYLIAVGGDGTLNEVVNGVMQGKGQAEKIPILGLLPLGSANDFARTAGISNSIEDLMGLIQTQSIQKIDLGKITLHKPGKIRYFINIAGVGLGPEVVQGLEKSSSILGPGFNYFKHIFNGFFTYRKKEVHCSSSDWQWEGSLLQMAIANGRYFGNAICIAPDARLADGQLEVVIFGDVGLWDYLKNLSKLKKGVKVNLPEVSYKNAREVLIESKDRCGLEADGEYVGLAPATINILPEALLFLAPPDLE
jgi:YegS/Rv2252/BmrU family lipid kinase